MDIAELTEHMHEFVESKGWYGESSTRAQNIRNLVISLNIESSEVLELVQWSENVENEQELADELADVALYLLQIASIAEIDLEQAIMNKLALNKNRQWDNKSNEKK